MKIKVIKVKRVGEERYFKSENELIDFCERQSGITIEYAFKSDVFTRNNCERIRMMFPNSYIDKQQEYFISGNFLFHAYYGYFCRTSGNYIINILAEQKIDKLSLNDIRKIINLKKEF